MNLETLLLLLRIGVGAVLMLFVGSIFFLMWRDYRMIEQEVDTRTRRRGRLVVTHSDGVTLKPGASFPLLPTTSLGRASTNTVTLHDAFASADHALVSLRGGQWWLEDRGSSNGTLLNGYRVEEPVVVSSGDVIAIGQIELTLELE